ncbi:GntR family transcriptional regulator [Defluviimonas sp. WL0024]|uniref:GntR family transcriptional regulator n=2 Tax=Albidovulum TaxID=205889 RepID=A0ABT3J634_9RHOB|nr:GntR family transcriptional regulator [Defluviimonas sp. WL0024]MCU9849910.1 GntR family transcriptional regulator [Defluviimonas sp. WL0024]MCW3783153.1 GntR family transcriptional regulator [Defluviimonas salinarum]
MQIDSVNIGQTASAAVIIYEALKKAIIEGQLKDGEPLRQDEIARMFNTSRIPVREALTMLEQQGLVATQRYKGAVVAGISPDEAAEIWDFRALVEGRVIEMAVPRMTPETLAAARAHLEAFSNAANPVEWGDHNRHFHTTLYRDSALAYHLGIVEKTLDRVDRYLRAQLSLSNGVARANAEHEAILAACEAGDAARAAELTRRHILGAKANLLDLLSRG